MAITDELRHNIEGAEQLYGRECPRLRAIADRIDEEHKKAMDNSYRDGYQEGKRDGDDDWYEEHESYLEEHGWYQALDADKEPIKFGDDVEWELLGSGETERGYVVGIKIDLIADRQSFRVKVVRDSDFQTIELMAKNLHHVKPAEPEPTVEDLLRDFGKAWVEWEDGSPCDPIAEYAAKLRLAGDAE